jgi:hypothetical protein
MIQGKGFPAFPKAPRPADAAHPYLAGAIAASVRVLRRNTVTNYRVELLPSTAREVFEIVRKDWLAGLHSPCGICGAPMSPGEPVVPGRFDNRVVVACPRCAESGRLAGHYVVWLPPLRILQARAWEEHVSAQTVRRRVLQWFSEVVRLGRLGPALPLQSPDGF